MIAGKGIAPGGQAIAQSRAEILALGIAAQQGFGHHDQRSAGGCNAILEREYII
jgi:hypothetical protein